MGCSPELISEATTKSATILDSSAMPPKYSYIPTSDSLYLYDPDDNTPMRVMYTSSQFCQLDTIPDNAIILSESGKPFMTSTPGGAEVALTKQLFCNQV